MFKISIIKDEAGEDATWHCRMAVRAVIYEAGKILMVKTNVGDYKFPGGGVEEGESRREALLREIREETGFLDVEIGPCIGTVIEQNEEPLEPGVYFRMESEYYICRKKSGKRIGEDLDSYEEKLGFHGVFAELKEVLKENLELLKQQTKGQNPLDFAKIPWLERETRVLECLAYSAADQMALEVYECGQILKNAERSRAVVDEKDGHANFVTSYDRELQKELRQRLLGLMPEAAFVGEEEESHEPIGRGTVFIVDPIDGTTNFIKDYCCSCISVGLAENGRMQAGIVYNPYLDELFFAERGKGAFLNGKRIRVSKQPLCKGLVLFGTAPYYENLARRSFQTAYEYFCRALDVRRSGSAALDLCNIACGRAELYFELRLSPWDFAAGSLIVEEAGGTVTTMEGEPLTFDAPCSLKATNGIAE